MHPRARQLCKSRHGCWRLQAGSGRHITEVVRTGPPLMMHTVSDLTRHCADRTVASLHSTMDDATGMCGACMVPVLTEGKRVHKHACIDGPEIDARTIVWDKFLPRLNAFRRSTAQQGGARARLIPDVGPAGIHNANEASGRAADTCTGRGSGCRG
jgi:hypothetical protein